MRLAFCLLLLGCEGVLPGIDWQQMNDQHKLQAYQPSSFFPDGRAMQTPPLGTVAYAPRPSQLEPAFKDGVYLDHFAIPLSHQSFDRGRSDFEIYCGTCHGVDGSGHSEVARNMDLRQPPSLLTEPVRSFPPGRIFQVATEGYGLMPSYAIELTDEERWAVTAYVVALQRSHSVALEALPPDVRTQTLTALKEQSP